MSMQEYQHRINTYITNKKSQISLYFNKIPHNQRTALLILLLLLLIITLASLVSASQKITKTQTVQNTSTTTSNTQPEQQLRQDCQPTENASQKDFEFVDEYTITNDSEIEKISLLFNDTEYLKNKLGITEDVIQMHYLQEKNQIVYLTGFSDALENSGHIREVKILDLSDDSSRTIFSYKTVYKEYEEAGHKMYLDLAILRSISVNDTQDKIGILTDKEIFVYDLEQNQFTFSHDGKTVDADIFRDTENNRHFFNTLTFSPNDQYAILSYGFYEGISYFLLDFTNKTIISLEKGGYGGGTFVEGWLGTNIVYIDSEGGGPPSYHGSLCLQSLTLSEPTCMELGVSGMSSHQIKTIGNNVYVLSQRSDYDKTFVSCNNVNNPFEFHPQFDSLMRYSFENQTETELLHKDTTRVSGFALKSKILDFVEYSLDGKPGFLIKIKLEDESITYGFLDPEVPEKLVEISL